MECSVEWNGPEGMLFVCSTGSGHTLTIDGPPDGGGNNLAPRPMETLLSGAGACSAYDVVMILQRGRKDIRRCRLNITSERADTEPKVFTKIHFEFIVSGRELQESVVERAINLSHEKYCSAIAMLNKTAEITHSFRIEEV